MRNECQEKSELNDQVQIFFLGLRQDLGACWDSQRGSWTYLETITLSNSVLFSHIYHETTEGNKAGSEPGNYCGPPEREGSTRRAISAFSVTFLLCPARTGATFLVTIHFSQCFNLW